MEYILAQSTRDLNMILSAQKLHISAKFYQTASGGSNWSFENLKTQYCCPLQIDFKLFLANSPVLYPPENTIKRLVFSFFKGYKMRTWSSQEWGNVGFIFHCHLIKYFSKFFGFCNKPVSNNYINCGFLLKNVQPLFLTFANKSL